MQWSTVDFNDSSPAHPQAEKGLYNGMADEQKKEENDQRPKSISLKARWGPLRMDINPVVTFLSAVIIWGFVIWCIVKPNAAKGHLTSAKIWVTDTWTWLYIATKYAWFAFIAYLFFSKYAKLKLGKPDDEPEFGDVTFFTMLFAAGVGVGLFYFGVAEPIWHYEPRGQYGNRYWGRYVSRTGIEGTGWQNWEGRSSYF